MPQGMSLHVGLNSYDPVNYGDPKAGKLLACENDARAMQSIADTQGFSSTLLLTKEATIRNVVVAIKEAAGALQAGDIFMMTYSGHGGQIPDRSKDEAIDEGASVQGTDPHTGEEIVWGIGGKDETLCLYDYMYWDDEFNRQLAQFKSGVRIIYIADCCHAESNFKGVSRTLPIGAPPPARGIGLGGGKQVYELNQAYYDHRWSSKDFLRENNKLDASLIQLASCAAGELSGDTHASTPEHERFGVFTGRLLQAWNNGRFEGNYQQLLNAVGAKIPAEWNQTPVYSTAGPIHHAFAQQQPFTI